MGQGQSPSNTAPSPALVPTTPTPPTDQQTLDAYHNEILVLAIGVLFLVSQLVLVIWLVARPHGDIQNGEDKEPRTIPNWTRPTIMLSGGELDEQYGARKQSEPDELDAQYAALRRRGFRRSGTWNGRARFKTIRPGPGRRKSSGGLELAELRSPPQASNSEAESASDSYSPGLSDLRRNGGLDAAAAQAMPIRPASPRHLRAASPLGSPGADSSDPNKIGGLLPARLSPRSPRVMPIDRKTISAILEGEKLRKAKRAPASRVVVKEQEEKELSGTFDDPLGVNRRASVFENEIAIGSDVSLGDNYNGERLRRRGKKRADSF